MKHETIQLRHLLSRSFQVEREGASQLGCFGIWHLLQSQLANQKFPCKPVTTSPLNVRVRYMHLNWSQPCLYSVIIFWLFGYVAGPWPLEGRGVSEHWPVGWVGNSKRCCDKKKTSHCAVTSSRHENMSDSTSFRFREDPKNSSFA